MGSDSCLKYYKYERNVLDMYMAGSQETAGQILRHVYTIQD